jgi:hypothetical protein
MSMSRILVSVLLFALLSFGFIATSASAQDVDCPQLTYQEAQDILAQDPSDPNRLDADNDGEACEGNTSDGGGADNGATDSAASGDDGDTTALPDTGTGPASASSSDALIAMLVATGMLCMAIASRIRTHARQ